MNFAFNKVTGKLESAAEASKWSRYQCPVCKTNVNLRAGMVRKAYFAHWPGYGSLVCENFVPSHNGLHFQEHGSTPADMKRMELCLQIPMEGDRSGWSLELVLPSCRECQATVTLDVGGRSQALDMRGMDKRRHVTAEPSVEPYRIIAYSGSPDHSFFHGVERECPGLPVSGAAVFSASGSRQLKGFPLAQELRCSETFALLWKVPVNPDFPEELFIDRIKGKKGWNLALVTLSDSVSQECINWLISFTGLLIAPPVPSITPIWPFLTKNASINEVDCIKSGLTLLSVEMMPVGLRKQGPTMMVQGKLAKRSAVGVEPSPAFFALKSGEADFVEIANADSPEINKFISFSLQHECHVPFPVVELVFSEPNGEHRIVALHQRFCVESIAEARRQEIRFMYLSIPSGVQGTLRVDDSKNITSFSISSGLDISPHSRYMQLPSAEILATLTSVLVDSTCHIELDFGGFGRLELPSSWNKTGTCVDRNELPTALRSRLLSFMLQLQISIPISVYADNTTLLKAFVTIQPNPQFIPHYRILMREVLASGYEL